MSRKPFENAENENSAWWNNLGNDLQRFDVDQKWILENAEKRVSFTMIITMIVNSIVISNDHGEITPCLRQGMHLSNAFVRFFSPKKFDEQHRITVVTISPQSLRVNKRESQCL